jgi:hypothetical protein
MNWSTERDALIAETMAFVQSVTGKQPEGAAETASVGPVSVATAPIDSPDSGSTELEQTGELPPVPVTVLPRSEIRKEVQIRIAAFQAHQHRFQREREAYFNSVLTNARLPKDRPTFEATPKARPR